MASEQRGLSLPALVAAVLAYVFGRVFPWRVRAGATAALATGVALGALHGGSTFAPATARSHAYDAVVVERAGPQDGDGAILRLADGRSVTAFLPLEPPPAVGARLRVRARFEPPDVARNPGEPSPREFATERGIAGRLTHLRVQSLAPPDPRDASLWLPRLRAWAGATLRARLAEPYATILAGALWGERGALPPDLRAEFQDTGTVHVLVTAGLHLGVIAALALWMLEACGFGRIGASLLAIVVVWAYAAFSGAHLPSMRAATMASFALLARAAGRPALSWNAFALAAVVVTALRPDSLFSLSFGLSFSCVGAILLFAKPFAHALERMHFPEFVNEALALTFATQLGTWPLTATGFLVIAPYAPLANALVVPVVGVAMLVGIAQLAATPVPFLAQACANMETSLLVWIVGVVRFVGNLPGAHVIATPPPAWTIVSYDVAMIAVAFLIAKKRFAQAALLAAAATALCLWPPRAVSHNLRVTAIDVGQADALLIQTPAGRAYLVDAGGRLERTIDAGASSAEAVGERVVVPFLIRHGIHHLDGVLISHPHGDHVGGLPPVLRTLGAGFFADSGQTYPGHAYHDALVVAHVRHIPMVDPRGGDVWRTDDGVTFRFYGPTLPLLTGTRSDINSNSLVFRIEYGAFRMLFTGDAGSEAEARMLADGYDLRADVLKVGHHGSAYGTTPEFVHAVAPRFAIISVGRDNLFGHPAARTLETLTAAGARIYRTDVNGAISVESNGLGFRVAPFLSPVVRLQLQTH
jgi:competence protein ComEC